MKQPYSVKANISLRATLQTSVAINLFVSVAKLYPCVSGSCMFDCTYHRKTPCLIENFARYCSINFLSVVFTLFNKFFEN